MNRVRNILFLIVMLFFGLPNEAHAIGQEEMARRILDYYAKVPGERLYIQTDRTCYMPGDTIWMRVHMTDAATSLPVSRSRYVYVELYERQRDTLVQRIIVKCDSDEVFAGVMLIPRKAKTGIYTLAAYTRWMQNFSMADFAYRHISIGGTANVLSFPDSTALGTTPPADNGKQAINVAQRKGQLLIEMRQPYNADSLYCVVCGSGNLIVTPYTTGRVLRISEQELRPGAMNIAIVNGLDGSIVAERAYVLTASAAPSVVISGAAAGKRQPMTVTVTAKTADGSPLQGRFAISVTDGATAPADSMQADIGQKLLAQPPHSIGLAMQCSYPSISHAIETEQFITGSIKRTLGGKVRKIQLNVINWITGSHQTFELGDSCRFRLAVDNPDGTEFAVEATRNGNKQKLLELCIDSLTFPRLQLPPATLAIQPSEQLTAQAQRQQAYNRNGLDMETEGILLGEVVTTGKLRTRRKEIHNFAGIEAPRGYKEGDPKIAQAFDLRTLLRPLGVPMTRSALTGQETINEDRCLVFDENYRCDADEIENLLARPVTDVASVEYFPANAQNAVFGARFLPTLGIQSVLFIHFKDGSRIVKAKREKWPNMVFVRQPGYQPPVSFYSPQYDSEEARLSTRPDERTTLYWNPCVTLDANGQATVMFYASDSSQLYDVTFEGVADDGAVVHAVTQLYLKNH